MSPEPLPLPPDDYGLLSQFPLLPKDRIPERLYRVHRVDREPQWFGTSGTMRFDPPDAAAKLFGTCYLAASPVTALVETFGDLLAVTQDMVDDRPLLEARIPAARQKLAGSAHKASCTVSPYLVLPLPGCKFWMAARNSAISRTPGRTWRRWR